MIFILPIYFPQVPKYAERVKLFKSLPVAAREEGSKANTMINDTPTCDHPSDIAQKPLSRPASAAEHFEGSDINCGQMHTTDMELTPKKQSGKQNFLVHISTAHSSMWS